MENMVKMNLCKGQNKAEEEDFKNLTKLTQLVKKSKAKTKATIT